MGPKSSVQSIVMHNLGSKYGQIEVKKRSFLLKKFQIDSFFVFFNSAFVDNFRGLSLTFPAWKKTEVGVNLLK